MFSTVDDRSLRAWRLDPGGVRRIEVPVALADAADRARALPCAGRVRDLADALARREDAAVRVEVWTQRFERDMQPRPQRLIALEAGGAERAPF